jgi:hypothetical protein
MSRSFDCDEHCVLTHDGGPAQIDEFLIENILPSFKTGADQGSTWRFSDIGISALPFKFSTAYARLFCRFLPGLSDDGFNVGRSVRGHVVCDYIMRLHARTKSA